MPSGLRRVPGGTFWTIVCTKTPFASYSLMIPPPEPGTLAAGVHVGGVAGADVVPVHVALRVEDAALRVGVALRRRARISPEGRRVEPRPCRVDVNPRPFAVQPEDAPAVRVLPHEE